MLVELRIENYAVIEALTVRLETGLNALTGETGAGKSIIVGALGLLLGERASTEIVRAGADRAVVEGVFDASGVEGLADGLHERGIVIDDGLVILRREIVSEGRSRAWINGAASTATVVGDVGRRLVDLHGQHEHQTLLRADEQRAILDAFADARALADAVATDWARVSEAQRALDELDARGREIAQRADFLRFQAEEIERAALREDEEDELEREASRLEHASELTRLATRLYDALYAAEEAMGAQLADLRRTLDALVRLDPACGEWVAVLDEARYGLEELGRQMGDYASDIEDNPARLEELLRRRDLLYRLKAKYGPTLPDVIGVGRRARAELDTLDGVALERGVLERARTEAEQTHALHCEELSTARRDAAARLDREVNEAIRGLGMPDGHFVTQLEALSRPDGTGAESVTFLVSANAGFEPAPLSRVASGGELSRVMLALKSILAREDRVPSLVFDEIDAGIGGRVAHHVAERLAEVALHHQVFVVTHLPQIASRADHQLVVEKADHAGRAATTVRHVAGEARIRELARMLGGDPESSVSLEHARELLSAAR